jgi:5-formyltetrahydrofolate cyclo-ligase
MLKREIRKLFLQKRKALSNEEVKEFNDKIRFQFNRFLSRNVKTLHIYLPIQSKMEIDTWPIIHGLWKQNIRIVVPVMNPQNKTMSSWLLTKETQLVENDWKVPQPIHSIRVDEKALDVMVVPLLTFDKSGFRVGYGKGYYDRFIASIDREILKIGLSFFPPVDQISDLDPWDIPLNYCITPDKIIKF